LYERHREAHTQSTYTYEMGEGTVGEKGHNFLEPLQEDMENFDLVQPQKFLYIKDRPDDSFRLPAFLVYPHSASL